MRITAHGQAYLRAIDAVREAMAAGANELIGIHLEEPFLSPARPGIHDPSAIRPLSEEDVFALEQKARDFPGVILLTLAPECEKPEYLDRLTTSVVILFAGHSEATAAQLDHMRGATHLWKAMPGPFNRTPGIVSEVLGGNRLFAGTIADGFDVGEHALKMSVRAATDRLCRSRPMAWCSFCARRAFRTEPGTCQLAAGRLMSGSSLIVAMVSSVM
ncbi:hypothetical protein [Rhizobium rosettiformans]|uniref:hypothetical protein n=1 Tax=Rhizobium rosettiformans TaxID=1368430 RepID=UPI002856AB16|nr:hypothetical protein [Rhizobium rosettiformans]MDR7031030.1 N-acetylglucosamine-6-phosphate deacetylase [Rhizobium rosettiformans]MDR7066934.1 N-acetylglucosamine-6-phosphate deacetylase [Rhizobium rosettiformans]